MVSPDSRARRGVADPPAIRRSAPRAAPLVGHLLAARRDRLGLLTRAARDHGDLVELRLGPFRPLLVSHPELVREVLVARQQAYRKGPILQRARVVLGNGLLTSEGAEHRRQRHLLNRAFHPSRMAGYARAMVTEAGRTADRWTAGGPVDVHAEMVHATLTVAGRTLFATDVAADVTAIGTAVDDMLSAYGLVLLPAAWRLDRMPVGPVHRLRRGLATIDEIVRRMVAARRASGRDHGDLLSVLVLAGDGGEPDAGLTDEQIRDQVVTLLLAGHETTANALTFAWHLLGTDPAAERRLHHEVDTVLADRTATLADRDRLPYTRGVIAEALRLYPPSWAMARQAVTAHELGGRAIAPGDVVVVSQWVVHRDPRWWPEPARFAPERWTGPAADRPRHAFFPFGGGARQCIGESFAWTEAVLALATLARRWRLRPVSARPVALAPRLTLRPRAGVWMRPEPR